MNKKYKIYLDTSVISYLKQEDALEKMKDTLEFFDRARLGMYEIYISDISLEELYECPEPKLSYLQQYISTIEYKTIYMNDRAEELANKYVEDGVIREKSIDDAKHIALASENHLDAIASWNFKHIVNYKTMFGVNEVNTRERYGRIDIVTPSIIISGGEDNGKHK
ncbi:MAG: hypothetical protein A2Y22_08195 [Clostridiales bacterium GWD2_32_59]|nr:MAG: hypothetical protein A2Y22_08195 [Clostridiales bacterium GWD2_32_59]